MRPWNAAALFSVILFFRLLSQVEAEAPLCGALLTVAACSRDAERPYTRNQQETPAAIWASTAASNLLDASTVVAAVENSPDRVSVLVLRDGSRFETTLFEVTLLSALRTVGKKPYLVMSGRGCTNCDANISIYVHSPSDGPMGDEATQARFAYPGRVLSYMDGSPIFESRMFIGDCLPAYPNGVVWYQRARGDNGTWTEAVFVLYVRADTLAQAVLRSALPSVSETLQRVAVGSCREVPGVAMTSEP